MVQYDTIIIGAGACGLMCAAQAGLLGKKTLLLERNDKAGAKILISGGGRCNYTNLYTEPENFVSENIAFLQAAFSQWSVADTVQFFEEYGAIQGQEKTLGQLFPATNKAKDVVQMFTHLLAQTGQEMWLSTLVKDVSATDGGYRLTVERQGQVQELHARKVVIATGGLPVQKLGASDFGLRVARQFGHTIVPTAPALVPLTITGKDADWYASLSGNAVFAKVRHGNRVFEENILFTHWGLSGPAILQISSYWRAGDQLTIDLLPTQQLSQMIKEERQQGGKRTVGQLLQGHFTKKFVDALGKYIPISTKIASLSKSDAQLLEQTIHHFVVKPAGDKGYDKAEVMRGGVSTDELMPKTLASKLSPGLYFGGECVDVTGWLGGYNFQWAWAAAYVIAQDL